MNMKYEPKFRNKKHLESPVTMVKSSVTETHHTMVGRLVTARPVVILWIACPVATLQILTASSEPVTSLSPLASQARHMIRPEAHIEKYLKQT